MQAQGSFYEAIHTTDGELYSISSWLGIWAGLNHCINKPLGSHLWNLRQDPALISANNVFSCSVTMIRGVGKRQNNTAQNFPWRPAHLEIFCNTKSIQFKRFTEQNVVRHSLALQTQGQRGKSGSQLWLIHLQTCRKGSQLSSCFARLDQRIFFFLPEIKNDTDPLEREWENQRA